jgi:hypothetical protein
MPATCSSRRWRAASCTASAPPRSTSTASTSRRTPRSNAASRRCWSTSRAWRHDRHPARPAGEVRTAPRRGDHRPGDRRRGRIVAPLHHRPLPARQGDRPDRRGGRAHQDGDRLQARGDGQARPAHHPAQDRARGGEEGEGRGLAQAAGPDRGRDRAPGEGVRRLDEVLRAEKAAVQGTAHIKAEIDKLRARWRSCSARASSTSWPRSSTAVAASSKRS